MIEQPGNIEVPSSLANELELYVYVCATDWRALAQPRSNAQCSVNTSRSAPFNSAQATRLQQRRFEPTEDRVVHRTPWESIGLIAYDPARTAPARWPTKKRRGMGGRLPDPPDPRFDLRRVLLGLQEPPLWFVRPDIWRRQGWVVSAVTLNAACRVNGAEKTTGERSREEALRELTTWFRDQAKVCHPDAGGSHEAMIALTEERDRRFRELRQAAQDVWSETAMLPPWYEYDKRKRAECISDMRRAERDIASGPPFPSGLVLTREMFVAELRHAYPLLWPWPSGRNETEAGVLDYTILRLLDWTPDATPATALAEALNAAGWSRARYARAFEDRQHFVNWLRKEARFYAKSLGRCRTMIPSMHDDIPVQFQDGKVALLGEKLKTAALALFKDERRLTDPSIDIWHAIAEAKPVDDGEKYNGLPSRATGRAERRGRRPKPSKITPIAGGDLAGRQTLAERYGTDIPQWQLKMIDRALDDLEQERQRDAALPRKFAGRYNDDAPSRFARDDVGDASGSASRPASGTSKARGAAAARVVVDQVHHEITFHEWLNSLDVDDDYETIRVIALTLHHWGNGEPHEDLAKMIGLEPEVVRGRLALAFEGLRQAIGYEPSRRGRVEGGIKKLAIRAETLENIAAEMTLQAQITVPAKNGGRPRKLDAKVAAERMRYAARLLSIMEITCERLPLILDGVASAPALETLVKLLDNTVAITPIRLNSADTAYLSVFEIIDALTDVGLLQDRQLRARPGGAARAAIALAWWTAPAAVGALVDLEKLLEEYTDREPRPPALAKPAKRARPAPARRRSIEDVRRVSWRRPDWHAAELGISRSGVSDRESVYMVRDRANVHADAAAAAEFSGVAP